MAVPAVREKDDDDEKREQQRNSNNDETAICPKCDSSMIAGVCTKCNFSYKTAYQDREQAKEFTHPG
jgi:hypothetical protein